MTTYLSSLLTSSTSKYTSLRRSLLSDSTETDGDTEDDSHICRALRAYYVEKGRHFPEWLPPDPRDARKQAAEAARMQQSRADEGMRYAQGGYSNPYARPGSAQQQQPMAGGARGGGLGDLFGSDRGRAPSTQQQPASLRRGISGGSTASGRSNFFTGASQDPQGRLSPQVSHGARPLPSQRAGSYQSIGDSGGAPPPLQQQQSGYGGALGGGSSAGGVPTAQDRLKQRLWGARGGGAAGGR